MSLSSILQQIQRKGKLEEPPAPKNVITPEKKKTSPPVRRHGDPPRPVDPIVAKLKEKRRLENEKKEQEARLLKGLAPKKPKSFARPVERVPRNPIKKPKTNFPTEPIPIKPPAKKMNFNELMKKASKIDQSKLSIAIQQKKKSPDPPSKSIPNRNNTRKPENGRRIPSNTTLDRRNPHMTLSARKQEKPIPRQPEKRSQPDVRHPLPIRKPSTKLEQTLKSKTRNRHHELDEDDEEDDWIVSDEEEETRGSHDAGYDRDEIWAMFNKGKKRSYYDRFNDYDSEDDMEATGAEILEEELRSKRRAELEDRKEMEEEKRLADLKKKRMRS
jgi:SPT2 chromatin protein.